MFKGADRLAKETKFGWIAGWFGVTFRHVDAIGSGGACPAIGETGVPTVVQWFEPADIAKVAVGDLELGLD